MPPKKDPQVPKNTPEEIEERIEGYKKSGYTYVPTDKLKRTLKSLPMGTRIVYLTNEDYTYNNGTKVGRVLRAGGWLQAKDSSKELKWFSLMAVNTGRVSWSVQTTSLEAILYRLKVEDNPRQPSAETVKKYEKLRARARKVIEEEEKEEENNNE